MGHYRLFSESEGFRSTFDTHARSPGNPFGNPGCIPNLALRASAPSSLLAGPIVEKVGREIHVHRLRPPENLLTLVGTRRIRYTRGVMEETGDSFFFFLFARSDHICRSPLVFRERTSIHCEVICQSECEWLIS